MVNNSDVIRKRMDDIKLARKWVEESTSGSYSKSRLSHHDSEETVQKPGRGRRRIREIGIDAHGKVSEVERYNLMMADNKNRKRYQHEMRRVNAISVTVLRVLSGGRDQKGRGRCVIGVDCSTPRGICRSSSGHDIGIRPRWS